jgi:RNA polymerase sigma factor (sigma-70 family)
LNVRAMTRRNIRLVPRLIARPLNEVNNPPWPDSALDQLEWLKELYERHSDFVRDVVARHAGPHLDAEDLVQNVFLVAYRKWKRLARYEQPRAWLNVASLREVWAARRRERLRRLLTFRFVTTAIGALSPEDACQERETRGLFYALLDRLPEKQRTAFVLYHVDELGSAEIARLLGCPESTVRTRLFHARRTFDAAAHRWQLRASSGAKNRGEDEP